MPYLTLRGCRFYYEDTQHGRETLVFSHGLLWSSQMFAEQIAHLSPHYRVVAYDHRGQGQSQATESGYDMDSLTDDALALLDALGIEQCHFIGLSMGGFVAMRLAARHPSRIQSLVLLETSAQPEAPENVPRYRLLCRVVRLLGTWAVQKPVMRIMFGQSFLTDPHRADLRRHWSKQLIRNPRSIVRAVQGVIDRQGIASELAAIRCPVLILVGDEDVATPIGKAQAMHQYIAGSQLRILPRAGHSATVEEPAAVNAAIAEFLATIAT